MGVDTERANTKLGCRTQDSYGNFAAVGDKDFFYCQVVGDQNCSANFQCRNCNKLTACELPEAEKTKGDGREG